VSVEKLRIVTGLVSGHRQAGTFPQSNRIIYAGNSVTARLAGPLIVGREVGVVNGNYGLRVFEIVPRRPTESRFDGHRQSPAATFFQTYSAVRLCYRHAFGGSDMGVRRRLLVVLVVLIPLTLIPQESYAA